MYRKLFIAFAILISFAGAKDLNIDSLLTQGKKENKELVFFFHIPGCPYCKAMLDENFKDGKIIDVIEKNFILVDIYTADKGEVTFKGFKGDRKSFAKHVGAFAFPATIFMEVDGEIVYRSIGYRNIDEHIPEFKFIATKSYKKSDLEAFKLKLELEED